MDKRTYKSRKEYLLLYYREYYKDSENRRRINDRVKKKSAENRLVFYEWKKSLACETCGETHPACLEFHHINPEEKDYCISNMAGKSLNLILKEVAKCKILCANCHRKLHNPIADVVFNGSTSAFQA